MIEKEYIVSLHKGVDAAQFNDDMIRSTGSGHIPNRSVDIANARPGSVRNTHYALTDSEAEELKKDPRVLSVEIPPFNRPEIQITHKKIQNNNFNKTTLNSGAFVNWGLRRINDATNLYVGNTAPGGYNYTIDGTGIDVVIQDSGIQFAHDEWLSPTNVQRLQRINWYTLSGLPGTQPGGFYSDYDGHGTHVAAIMAGKSFGWAKSANIYSMKIQGLQGPTDPGFGINAIGSFDLIKNWHFNKPNDPITGVKRPTILNISWGYSQYFSGITGGVYRGVPWVGITRDTSKGMIGANDGTGFLHPIRISAIDVEIEELIDAGVHVIIASGNTFQKIDTPSGVDYDNYYTSSSYVGPQYYHRGGSPYHEKATIVGNVDSEIHIGGLEQKAQSSETGPGVDLYAPGTNIVSASSNISIYSNASYQFGNFFWKQMNISGSSMSAPQAGGVLSLFLQLNPTANVEQGKEFLKRLAKTNQIYSTGLDDDYTDFRSLLGGSNRFLFNKFNSANQIGVTFPNSETYELTSDKNQVLEGETVTFTLNTQNVLNGTSVPYTITGVSSTDINGTSLTGNFVINANTASLVLTISEDFTTEGNEILVLELDNGKAITGCIIVDNSTGAVAPTYNLFADPDTANEGSTFTVTLITEFLDNGDTVPYTITGVSSNDIDGATLTDSFVINNNRADITFTVTADRVTETNETFTLTLNNAADSVSVVLNDTSLSPTFSLSASANPVPEGLSLIITLTTENVFDGETFGYTISGVNSSDINDDSLTGSFTVNSNSANLVLLVTEDITTEGVETLTLTLDNAQASINVNISDTSPARPLGVNRTINIVNNSDIAYTISGIDSTGSINGDNITINIDYGDTLILLLNAPGYPFYLKTQPVTGQDFEILGILNNGDDVGSITWTPRSIGTFYYQASNDASMGGQIIVS